MLYIVLDSGPLALLYVREISLLTSSVVFGRIGTLQAETKFWFPQS